MSPDDIISSAGAQTSKLVDQLIIIFALHEGNKHIVYSDHLVAQIPRSYAANAYNMFQDSSLLFELLRLSVLWDRTKGAISIPNVSRLLDRKGVLARLGRPRQLSPGEGQFHQDLDRMAYERLLRAKRRIAWIENSDRMTSLRNFRDKKIAHELERTSREKNGQVIALPRYQLEDRILLYSVQIVDAFHRCINQTGFDWRGSMALCRRDAAALWRSCTFDIQTRHQRFTRPEDS